MIATARGHMLWPELWRSDEELQRRISSSEHSTTKPRPRRSSLFSVILHPLIHLVERCSALLRSLAVLLRLKSQAPLPLHLRSSSLASQTHAGRAKLLCIIIIFLRLWWA
ncbi:hypothetical protein BT93_G0076 [Corymbia citriodora subsp. variegata]|nr:hypothetical protein BT93_G0076 [Corymbia citriodora subsp. variegata]